MIRRFLVLLMVLAVLVAAVGVYLFQRYQAFRSEPMAIAAEGIVYELSPGATVGHLARDLHARGAIDHPYWLIALGRHSGLAERLQAGEYRILQGTSPDQLLELIAAGKVLQHELTLVEGHNFRQLLAQVRGHTALVQTFEDLPDADIMARIGHPGEHPEGRFLPDTYHFPRGTTDAQFLKRAYSAMARYLDQAWQGRAEGLPLKSPYEALILASIVEKETGRADERPAIAGVFVRRLNKGMRLQTDPTVIYGLGESFDGDIRYRDLRTDTPYNTYTRSGLPPTPIAMPGTAAIDAALHPADGKALYFVSRGDGSHHFSATLSEHNRAVTKYQKKR